MQRCWEGKRERLCCASELVSSWRWSETGSQRTREEKRRRGMLDAGSHTQRESERAKEWEEKRRRGKTEKQKQQQQHRGMHRSRRRSRASPALSLSLSRSCCCYDASTVDAAEFSLPPAPKHRTAKTTSERERERDEATGIQHTHRHSG